MESPPEDTSDARLAALARRGEESAFTELFRRHYDPVRAFAARMLLDVGEGEEVAQEAFVRAARGMASLRDDASFRSWLFQIAANLCRDAIRRRTAHRGKLEELAREQTARGRETTRDIEAALAALGERERAAVVLVYYEGLNHAEAARALGCSEVTVSWRIHRAKKRLQKLLRP